MPAPAKKAAPKRLSPKPVTSKIMKVTPALAEQWLGRNSHNRPLRNRRVEELAGAMQRGEWILNGDAIRFDVDDTLLDGQHRLWAVVESDVTIETLVIEGLTVDSQETMDMGARRNLRDALVLRGFTNASAFAAAITYQWRYQNDLIRQPSAKPTVAQAVALIDEHPNLVLYVSKAKEFNRRFHLSSSMIAVAWYEFAQIDDGDAENFFDKLKSGIGLNEGDPILALRRWCERSAMGGGSGTRSGAIINSHALLNKAWNAYRDGIKVQQLNWKSGGAKAEAFPEPH